MCDAEQPLVMFDTPCRSCGYSLQGLPLVGRCPECGEAVADSINDCILALCEPNWIAGRATAMSWILWGTLAYFAMNGAWAFTPSSRTATVDEIAHHYRAYYMAESVLTLALAIAHWRLASPARDVVDIDGARWAYRGGVLTVLAARSVAVVLMVTQPIPLRGTVATVYMANTWVGNAGLVVGTVGFLAYLGRLALRIPNSKRSLRAARLAWATGLLLTVYVSVGVWVNVMRPVGRLPNGYYAILSVLSFGLLVCTAVGVAETIRLRHRFRIVAASRAARP